MTPKKKLTDEEREKNNMRALCHGLLAVGFFTISSMISENALTPGTAVLGTAIMAVWTFAGYVIVETLFKE